VSPAICCCRPALYSTTALVSCVLSSSFCSTSQQKSCAPDLTVPGSAYCTDTELKLTGSLSSWALTQHWVSFSSVWQLESLCYPTAYRGCHCPVFHLYMCSGVVIQRPTNELFAIHSYSAHEVMVCFSGISLVPGLVWCDLFFQAGLSRIGSWFWQRWSHNHTKN